jgi:hypothetical protein
LVVNIVHNPEKVVKVDGTIVPKQSAACTYDATQVEAARGLKRKTRLLGRASLN